MSRARKILAPLLAVVAICLLIAPAAHSAASDAPYNNAKILEFMNAERQARGVRTLGRDSALDRKAQEWAVKLAAEGRMYHSSSYAGMAVGYRSAAQNLAYHDDALGAAQAHNLWMASSSHRKNMLDPAFSHVGIAMACSAKSGRPYVITVVEFGGDAAPSQSTPPRNPQVAGGSGNSRAMSCDGEPASSGGGAPDPRASTQSNNAAPASQPAPKLAAASSSPSPTTSTTNVAKATSTTRPTSTTAARKASTTTPTTSPRGTTQPATAALAAVASPAPSISPSPTPAAIPADLAGAHPADDRSALWLIGLSAIAGMVVAASMGRSRRPAHIPKHSRRSGRRT